MQLLIKLTSVQQIDIISINLYHLNKIDTTIQIYINLINDVFIYSD